MNPTSECGSLGAQDHEGRRLANREFSKPVVLQAGAGTGKTTALVARIVVHALGPGFEKSASTLRERRAEVSDERIAARVLGRIVAITFTEAAAAEMARRTGEAFLEVADGRIPEGIQEDELPAQIGDRKKRARALASALDRLVVRTLHAFARRLLAAHPLEAGLHPGFEVDADGSATASVVREAFEVRLRDALEGDREDPLFRLLLRGASMRRVEEDLQELATRGVLPEWLERDPFDAEEIARLVERLRAALESLCGAVGSSLAGSKMAKVPAETLARAADARDRLATFASVEGVAGMRALGEIVAELAGRTKVLEDWAGDEFSKTVRKLVPEASLARARSAAAILHPLLAWLGELDAETLDLARRVLAPLLREVRETLRRRGLVSYDDLLRDAVRLLRESESVRECERAAIDQILVDEFQDTDALQCELVAWLALDGDADERPGLFLVGDPKQSIYGWRGADLRAYEGFLERVRRAGGCFGFLSVNHRSVAPILDEVARVMRPAMQPKAGVQPAFEDLESSQPLPDSSAFEAGRCHPVEYWISRELPPPPGGTRSDVATQLEARAIARDVSRLVREHGVEPRRIAILLRSLTQVEEILRSLREAEVPHAVARDQGYYRRREIADASALVRCILDPADELAWIVVLRSSLVGAPDAALAPLHRLGIPARLAALDVRDAAALEALARDVSAALADVPDDLPGAPPGRPFEPALQYLIAALPLLRASHRDEPSDVFVARLRRLLLFEVGEASRPSGAFRHANLERFFRELDALLAHGASPAEALRWLRQSARDERDADEGRPLEAAEQAVQVMSIHKAKGLSFDHVYVAQLHRESRAAPARDLPAIAKPEGDRIALRLLDRSNATSQGLAVGAAETEAAEQVRALYVAMTRARHRLVLVGLWREAGRTTRNGRAHVGILKRREGGVPDLDLLAEQPEIVDPLGICWRASAKIPASSIVIAPDEATREGFERASRDATLLAEQKADAAARQARRFSAAVTAEAHEAFRERFEATLDSDERPTSGRGAETIVDSVAGRVGTAIHRSLEVLDPTLDREALERAMREVARPVLAHELEGEPFDAAVERVDDLVRRFAGSELALRLRGLAPHLVARELSVLLPPEAGGSGAVGSIVGSIDLVYRDPQDASFVVVDYKTDRVESEDEIAQAVARHAEQGARYALALERALGLETRPRFELWFLHPGRIVAAP